MGDREREVEKLLVKKVKEVGGLTFKLLPYLLKGLPDRIVIIEGRVWFVELKSEDGRLSPLQKLRIESIIKVGGEVVVLYGKKDVVSFFASLSNGCC